MNLNFYPQNDAPKGTGRVSFSGVMTEGNVLQLGIAVTGRKEAFNRKRGRIISTARALNKPFHTINVDGKSDKQIATEFVTICKAVTVEVPYGTGNRMVVKVGK